ncbi:hypothetical protein N431DRAFT_170212 [Stipitochalara longipes BDJ]|nr:hypothetical protein N431DRAFT_170212 [Stipitochalara longipes BDJ]
MTMWRTTLKVAGSGSLTASSTTIKAATESRRAVAAVSLLLCAEVCRRALVPAEGGEACGAFLQVFHQPPFSRRTAREGKARQGRAICPWLASQTARQKAGAAQSHRLGVTVHRGVALADPENLSDSEAWWAGSAGGGCCFSSRWMTGTGCPGTRNARQSSSQSGDLYALHWRRLA